MSLRKFAIFIVCFGCVVYSVHAQDPFSDEGDALDALGDRNVSAQAGQGPSSDAIDVRERDAVVLSLRRDPPQDPIGLAKAIQWMARIQRWDEAGRWLDKIAATDVAPSVAQQIVETIGSQPLFDLENQVEGLTDAQRATAAKIRQLAIQAAQDPKTLSARVEQLRSGSKGERLAAFQALRDAGYSGITAILNFVMAENAPAPNATMVEGFSLLGDYATRAWQVAMTTPHADARERLVALVAPAPKPKMGCELMVELHNLRANETLRQQLLRSFSNRDGTIPSAATANQYASKLIDNAIGDYQRRARVNEVDTEITWALGAEGRTVSEVSTLPAHLAIARASQAGQAALRLTPTSDLASATAIAAHWEYLALRGDADATRDPLYKNTLPESLRDSHEFACLIWDAAVKWRLAGAQALAASNLTRWEGASVPVPVRERLVAATRSGIPLVRYTATQSLMKSMLEMRASPDGEHVVSTTNTPVAKGFDGSSRIEVVGREMQQLTAEPIALIVGGNAELRSYMQGMLEQYGYRNFEAASAAEVFSHLRSGLPIEAIFIVFHVRELDLGQLVQRIRANPATSTVPIAMLADSLSRGEHSVAEQDHQVVMSGVPPSVQSLGDIVARLDGVADHPAITREARIIFRESANNYLNTFRSPSSSNRSPSSDMLVANSREQQNLLLRIASDSTETEAKREQASRNFVQSVRRFGLLITSEIAQDQYDVYNQRGESEPITRAALGRILDAIEASEGKRPWSDVTP